MAEQKWPNLAPFRCGLTCGFKILARHRPNHWGIPVALVLSHFHLTPSWRGAIMTLP
jgi:hypothetical protein